MNAQDLLNQYALRNVFWGRELPKISLYDANWRLIDEHVFQSSDNFRMDIRFPEKLDSMMELEDGTMRKRVRGYRLFVEMKISNIENRSLMLFLRKMWLAQHVVITPHYGTMLNPDDYTYNFEVLVVSDFEPRYFDGRFIGHEIEFTLQGVDLLSAIPNDDLQQVIPATDMVVEGVTQPDPRTSITYWGEKLFYGGWEKTAEDFRYVAFWEEPDEAEIEEYGRIW
jgi:hypothetical protein